jgi:hypothetical protein
MTTTKVTNAFTQYNAQANREDLSDAIYNIDPYDTPFMSTVGRRNVDNRIFDWQTEQLPAVNAANAAVEGFELARSAATPTVRVNNTVQISVRDATVSGSQNDGANPAGKKKEMAHQMALVSKALKRDMETILCSQQARNDGADANVARRTRSLEHWITSNVAYGASGANPVSATANLTDGTLRALTEVLFNDRLQAAYEAGAEPKLALVGPGVKRKISTFVGRSGSQIPISKNEAVNTVDIYRSDFGDIKIVPSRWIRSRTLFLLDPQYAAVAYFRPFRSADIAKIGDAETKMILAEYGLEMKNERAHAKIADINPAL